MSFNDEPESPLKILQVAHADGFSDQAGDSVAPFVVQAFDDAGFTAAFATWPMLPRGEPLGIGFIEVAVDQLAAIRSRQRKPQADETLGAAVADAKANHLPCQARDRQPQVAVAPLEAKADDQLVYLQRIAFDGRQQRVGKTQVGCVRLFLSISRTVVRATRNVRAMARCDSRSCNAAAIKASFSADKARLRACGVHVLEHFWQRSRWLPAGVKPNRTTGSLSLHTGQS